VNGITASSAPWYFSRATGVVCLVLLTGVVVLGVLVNRGLSLPGLPKFAVTGLHRSISLLSVVFLGIHVATAVFDPYVSIGVTAAFVPFVSSYQPLWMGLGAVSLDLLAAIIVTSLLRARMGRRPWRAVHLLAYASWPIAVVHGVGAGPDLMHGWGVALTAVCLLAGTTAAAWRLGAYVRSVPRVKRVGRVLASGSR
jgi:methionine sulfoxide reductase heme-binding subunit